MNELGMRLQKGEMRWLVTDAVTILSFASNPLYGRWLLAYLGDLQKVKRIIKKQ